MAVVVVVATVSYRIEQISNNSVEHCIEKKNCA